MQHRGSAQRGELADLCSVDTEEKLFMRVSAFWDLMSHEFGAAYSRVLARDLVLTELGERTAAEALESGADPKTVWFAVCRAQEIPESRWWGPDQPPRR